MPDTCIVIPRVAPRRAWPDRDTPVLDLMLPVDPARPGFMGCWDPQGGHSEAQDAYYLETKPPRTPAEREAAAALVRQYQQLFGSDCTVVERQRRPADWRRLAWR